MTQLSAFRSESCKARYLAKYDEVLKTWPVPYRERDVNTLFGTTHIIESGAEDLPPLLLFHGASTTAVLWQPLIAQLSRHYRCFAIDTIFDPNKSELAAPLSGNDDVVAWMKDILAALGIQKRAWRVCLLVAGSRRCWSFIVLNKSAMQSGWLLAERSARCRWDFGCDFCLPPCCDPLCRCGSRCAR